MSKIDHARTVFTYCPATWPQGIITGHSDNRGGFVIEHVVSFDKTALLPMLRAGIAAATKEGFAYLTFGIPYDFPLAPRLQLAALRVGFTTYHEDLEQAYCVRYLP